MEENEKTEKNAGDIKKEVFGFLKSNPSLIVAIISAIITIITILSNYAGRLANVVYLKYWGIDSLYSTIETKGILYRVSNAIIWFVSIFIVSTLLQKVFVEYCHYSTPVSYLKKSCENHRKRKRIHFRGTSNRYHYSILLENKIVWIPLFICYYFISSNMVIHHCNYTYRNIISCFSNGFSMGIRYISFIS